MRFCIFHFIDRKNAMRNFFLSTEQKGIHKNNAMGRGSILFDIHFLNKLETDSNV